MKDISIMLPAVILCTSFTCGAKSSEVENNQPSILDSKEDVLCVNKTQSANDPTRYHDCLTAELHKSDKKLNDMFQKKIKEIKTSKNYDFYNSVASDRKSLRPAIEAAFRHQQQIWIDYRNSYCESIVSGEITGDGAFVGNVACTINMNKRRVEEIDLMYNPAAAW